MHGLGVIRVIINQFVYYFDLESLNFCKLPVPVVLRSILHPYRFACGIDTTLFNECINSGTSFKIFISATLHMQYNKMLP